VLYDPERLPLEPPIRLEDYLAVPHVLGSLSEDAHGVVDDALALLKLRRTIAVTTPHFMAVPFVLKQARDFSVSMLWHASYDHDPGISGCARRSPGSLLDP
jgi:LysR family transcriptional regulator, mexEF-oprN operon transcriptional activator